MIKTSKGYIFALITVTIWAGWAVATRYGMTHSLTAMDITFLRFTFAGLVMAPIAYKHRKLINKKQYYHIFWMIVGAGPLYLLSSTTGFENAPTTHGVLIPSLMALFSAISANYLLKEKISKVQLCGYFLIVLGVILRFEASSLNDDYITADSYFVLSAVLWTIYSIQYKKTGLDPIVATAFVTVGSMIIMIPPYIIYQLNNPHNLDISGSIVQVVFQGLLASIVALITFNKSVQILGASKATSFAALVPALVVIFAAPILDEQPDMDDIIFVILMSLGVLFASGAIKKPSKLV